MEKINVSVEKYSGPMDLLLNLIEKNKLDIYDIPLEKITKEYIETINRLTNVSSEEMAEFVSMASTLVYLKSKGLVPKSNYEDFEDEISLVVFYRYEGYIRSIHRPSQAFFIIVVFSSRGQN